MAVIWEARGGYRKFGTETSVAVGFLSMISIIQNPDGTEIWIGNARWAHWDPSASLRLIIRDENGTDIFRPYSKPNPFRGVLIRPYSSPDI
jgi:hypothetical protein